MRLWAIIVVYPFAVNLLHIQIYEMSSNKLKVGWIRFLDVVAINKAHFCTHVFSIIFPVNCSYPVVVSVLSPFSTFYILIFGYSVGAFPSFYLLNFHFRSSLFTTFPFRFLPRLILKAQIYQIMFLRWNWCFIKPMYCSS